MEWSVEVIMSEKSDEWSVEVFERFLEFWPTVRRAASSGRQPKINLIILKFHL